MDDVALSDASEEVPGAALALLRERGFRVWLQAEARTYWAEKDGWDFSAPDLLALLGVAWIYEELRPAQWSEYWWRIESGLPKLPSRPEPYVSVTRENK